MPTLLILRGLPGSGKTSLTSFLRSHTYISGDEFWTGPHIGKAIGSVDYAYDTERESDCASWVRQRLMIAMSDREPLVVLDRTHTRWWEFQYALTLAKELFYLVRIVAVEATLEQCLERQTHAVPAEKVAQMRDRWQPLGGDPYNDVP